MRHHPNVASCSKKPPVEQQEGGRQMSSRHEPSERYDPGQHLPYEAWKKGFPHALIPLKPLQKAAAPKRRAKKRRMPPRLTNVLREEEEEGAKTSAGCNRLE